MKSVWEELQNFQPIPGCACGGVCTYGLAIVRDYMKTNYVVRFLRGLNEQYSHVRSQIMLMKPLPDINEAFSLLTQEERQVSIDTHDSVILLNTGDQRRGGSGTRGRGRGQPPNMGGRGTQRRGKSSKVCTYCQKSGHIMEECYKKHGYPRHMQKRNSVVNNFASKNNDDRCEEDSFSRKEDVLEDEGIVFTKEQKVRLLALLQQSES